MTAALHPDWQTFLNSLHAVIENGAVLHYDQPKEEFQAASNATILCDLSHLALVRAEGADTESFLQGQLTNDIRLVTSARAQLSAYCNPKGRMLALFLISKCPEGYLLQLPAALAEGTVKRLRMFVLRAKVKLEPADPSLIATGLSGMQAEAMLQKLVPALPAHPYDCLVIDSLTILRLPGIHPRFQLIASVQRQIELCKSMMAQGATPAGLNVWNWLDIQAGIPVVLPGTVEEFVPQMCNLDVIQGVSFTKGCYPGQEIVARMHYLGKLKQRMYRLHAEVTTPPLPGAAIYAPSFPGQSAGNIVIAADSPGGGVDMLAVIQSSAVEIGELHLGDVSGPLLQAQTLPYELPASGRVGRQ